MKRFVLNNKKIAAIALSSAIAVSNIGVNANIVFADSEVKTEAKKGEKSVDTTAPSVTKDQYVKHDVEKAYSTTVTTQDTVTASDATTTIALDTATEGTEDAVSTKLLAEYNAPTTLLDATAVAKPAGFKAVYHDSLDGNLFVAQDDANALTVNVDGTITFDSVVYTFNIDKYENGGNDLLDVIVPGTISDAKTGTINYFKYDDATGEYITPAFGDIVAGDKLYVGYGTVSTYEYAQEGLYINNAAAATIGADATTPVYVADDAYATAAPNGAAAAVAGEVVDHYTADTTAFYADNAGGALTLDADTTEVYSKWSATATVSDIKFAKTGLDNVKVGDEITFNPSDISFEIKYSDGAPVPATDDIAAILKSNVMNQAIGTAPTLTFIVKDSVGELVTPEPTSASPIYNYKFTEAGDYTVTASCNYDPATAMVTDNDNVAVTFTSDPLDITVAAEEKVVSSIELAEGPAELKLGGTETAQYTVVYKDADGVVIDPADLPAGTTTFKTGHTNVATVDANGLVTAVGAGSTTVDAKFVPTTGTTVYTTAKVAVNVAAADVVEDKVVSSIELAEGPAELKLGGTETAQYTVVYKDADGVVIDAADLPAGTTTFKTGHTNIATVDANGLVTAVGAGSTTVSAKFVPTTGTTVYTADVAVNVSLADASDKVVASIALAEGPAELKLGGTETAQYTVVYKNADGVVIDAADLPAGTTTFKTGLTNIATVDANGLVTAVGAGSTTVSARFVPTTGVTVYTANVAVNVAAADIVEEKVVSSIELAEGPAELKLGGTETAQYTVVYKDADGVVIDAADLPAGTTTFKTGLTNIATVDANGLVTAVGAGSTTVSARFVPTTGTTVYTANVAVNVAAADVVEDKVVSTIELAEGPAELKLGGTQTAQYTVVYKDADGAVIDAADLPAGTTTFKTGLTNVATVDANGLVTAVGVGSTTVSAKFVPTTGTTVYSANVNVNVSLADTSDKVVASIALAEGPAELKLGGTETAQYTVVYKNADGVVIDAADLPAGTTTFKTGLTNIATVDANGLVTAVGAGSTTVSAKFVPTTGTTVYTANVAVNVAAADVVEEKVVASIELAEGPAELKLGGTETAQYTVVYKDADGVVIDAADLPAGTTTFKTGLTNIATVDANGLVTAVGVGSTTVSAKFVPTTGTTVYTANVAVNVAAADVVEDKVVASIELAEGPAELKLGGTETAQYTVVYKDADGVVIDAADLPAGTTTFKTGLTNVATVDANGLVTAVGVGSTTVSAKFVPTTGTTVYTANVAVNVSLADASDKVVASIELAEGPAELKLGGTETAQYTVVYKNADGVVIDAADLPAGTTTFKTGLTNVATVDANGLVTAVGVGSTTVSAKFVPTTGTTVYTADVTVNVAAADVVEDKVVASIELAEGPAELKLGGTETAQYTVVYKDADGVVIDAADLPEGTTTFKTEHTNVATVDANGLVTAVGAGSTTVSAKFVPTTGTTVYTANVAVNVAAADAVTIKSVSLATDPANTTTAVIPADQTFTTVKLVPSAIGTDDQPFATATYTYVVKYKATADGVETTTPDAAVDNNGVLTLPSAGIYTVTATAGGIDSNPITITVTKATTPDVKVTAIDLTGNTTTSLVAGTTLTLNAVVTPDTATNKAVTWTSSNPEVATVDPATGVVTAIKAGEVTITATAADGSLVTSTITLTVTAAPIEATKVTIGNKGSIKVGGTRTLNAVVYGADDVMATDQTVTWSSSNTAIATVNATTGVVTGVKAGTATITATTATGIKDTYVITVTANSSGGGGGSSSGGGSSIVKKPIDGTTTDVPVTGGSTDTVATANGLTVDLGNNPFDNKYNIEITKVDDISDDAVKPYVDYNDINSILIPKTLTDVAVSVNGNATSTFNNGAKLSFNLSDVDFKDLDTGNLVGVIVNPDTGKVEYLGGRYNPETGVFETETKKLYGDVAVIYADPANYNQATFVINQSKFVANGTTDSLEAAPTIVNGTTFVPVRAISETFGANVSFDVYTKTATISLNGKSVDFQTGVSKDGAPAPIIVNSRMLIPLRFVSETLDANVIWYANDKTIQVTK